MRISVLIIAVTLLFFGCVEPIDFPVDNEPRRLVVEGLISNVSFNDRLNQPADPFPFYVRLGWSSDVGNERDPVISNAEVTLFSTDGNFWEYGWSETFQRYLLPYEDFKAVPDLGYFLEVILPSGERYISDTEYMIVSPEVGSIDFVPETKVDVIEIASGTEIIEQRGIRAFTNVTPHDDGNTYNYRWDVVPSWIFEASLPPETSPVKRCWITNLYYFSKVNVGMDQAGGYPRDLFFLETDGNRRIEWQFSAWITQYSLSPEAYRFWEEISIQQQSGGGIFDPPPFELSTNIKNTTNENEKISGFFMVAYESSTRWYFDADDLPYDPDFGPDPCRPPPGVPNIPTPDCLDCRNYAGGASSITNMQPIWWPNN
jgi:hypothetical protein